MNEKIKELFHQAYGYPIDVVGEQAEKFAELIVADAFRAGMLYSAKKYAAVAGEEFTGNDVAMFLEMESDELSDDEIKQHFGVEE